MKQALSGIILIFAAFLINVYAVVPKYTQFKQATIEVAKKEEFLRQKQERLMVLQKVFTELEKNKESLNKIESALPQEISLPSLMNFFQAEATKSGLLLKEINEILVAPTAQEEGQPQPKLKEGKVYLGVKGAVSSFESFLIAIEQSSRLIWVDNMSLKQRLDQLPEFSLSVRVYSY